MRGLGRISVPTHGTIECRQRIGTTLLDVGRLPELPLRSWPVPAPIVLLPPSEGKADGGTGPPWTPGSISFPELDASRRKVAAALKRTAVALSISA